MTNRGAYRDEILYHARLHPECYTHNLEEAHVADLHKALCYVTKTAVETDADSSKFPTNWLMLHRWGKGKKDKSANRLPTGEPIEFITVGGRTSAYVRELQRKVGPVAGGAETSGSSNKRKRVKQENSESDESSTPAKESSGGRSRKRTGQAESKTTSTQRNAPDTKAESAVSGDKKPEVHGSRRSSRRKA